MLSCACAVTGVLAACNAKLADDEATGDDGSPPLVDGGSNGDDGSASPDATLPKGDGGGDDDASSASNPEASPPDASAPDARQEWSEWIGLAGQTTAVAVDHQGNVIVAGTSGGSPLLAKLAPDGTILWQPTLSGAGTVGGVAVDSHDDIILSGTLGVSALDFGGGPLSSGGYVVKFASNGAHVWSEIVVRDGQCSPVAVTPSDEIVVAGIAVAGTVLPGDGGVVIADDDGGDGFAAKLDTNGVARWATSIETRGLLAATPDLGGGAVFVNGGTGGLATHIDTNGVVLGNYSSLQDIAFWDAKVLPSGDVLVTGGGGGSDDGILIHLTSTMDLVSSMELDPSLGAAEGIQLDDEGGVVLGGETLHAGPWLARMALDGGLLASRTWDASTNVVRGVKIGLAPNHSVYLFGALDDPPMDLGQGPIAPPSDAGGVGGFVARERF